MSRKTKEELYEVERRDVLEKLLLILNVSKTHPLFFSDEITEEKEEQIRDLEEEIKKYYKYGSWPYYKKCPTSKNIINLIKPLLREMNISVRSLYSMDSTGRKIERKGCHLYWN